MVEVSEAAQARSLSAAIEMPGGESQPFCDAVMTTSSPHASISSGIEPSEETQSTRISGSATSRTAAAISAIGLVTPVEVSLWVISSAR